MTDTTYYQVVNVWDFLFSATSCLHLQCFDAALFLEMNELKQTFICPVCDKEALYENLVIDEYFQEVLASCSINDDNHEIELKNDGSWNKFNNKNVFFNLDLTPEVGIRPTISVSSESPPNKASGLIDLTGVTPVKPKTSMKRINTMPNKTNATVDLTFSDSDDDSKIALKKKKRSD